MLQDLQTEQISFSEPICFQLRLQKTGQIVEVDGKVATQANFVCGRCLQGFKAPVKGDFALTFTPRKSDEGEEIEEEVELEADDLGLIFYQDDVLELQDALQEQLIMALPIRPLCQDDCKGLCPECGIDLNQKQCNCVKKPFNSKFSALARLKLDK